MQGEPAESERLAQAGGWLGKGGQIGQAVRRGSERKDGRDAGLTSEGDGRNNGKDAAEERRNLQRLGF